MRSPSRLARLLTLLAGASIACAAAGQEAAPLSPRGEANLAAFARLLAIVRFFHPSDQAAATDWNGFAAASIARVEAAPDDAALAALLAGRFRPLAPTVQVLPVGAAATLPPALARPPGEEAWRVAWRHYGVALDGSSKLLTSDRIDDRGPLGYGSLSQSLAADAWRGQTLRFTAWARAELPVGARAELWVRVVGAATNEVFRQAPEVVLGHQWAKVAVEAPVAADAKEVQVGLLLSGGGRAWFDEAQLVVAGQGGEVVPLTNPAFEQGEPGRQPPGWDFPYWPSLRAGYRLALHQGGDCFRGGCAAVVADPLATPRFPDPAAAYELPLGSGLVARVPLALWADGRGTLPHATLPRLPPAAVSPRAERLAAVALAWGVLRHFYPYFADAGVAWEARLEPALREAAAASDPEAMRAALRRLLVGLGDANANVLRQRSEPRSLPLAWELIEGQLVVTATAEGAGGIEAGDLVTAIDGRPAAEVLADAVALVSAPSEAVRRELAAEELLWGEAGSALQLTVQAPDGRARTAAVARSRHYVEGPVVGGPLLRELAPGVLYVDLRRLDDDKLTALLPQLARAHGLVFEARGSVDVGTVLLSHLTDRERTSASWQLPVLMRPDREGEEVLTTFWTIPPRPPRLGAKVAFLIDRRCYAYVETLLTMVEEHHLGTLVGEPTAGNLGVVARLALPGGWSLTFTAARAVKADGSPLYAVGVRPQSEAQRSLAAARAGRDEVIAAGLAAVR